MSRKQWEIKVPVIYNRLIMRPIFAAVFPFLAIAVYLVYRSEGEFVGMSEGYALVLLAILFVLSILFWLSLSAGKSAPGYIIDEEGIVNYSLPGRAVKNRFLRLFLVFFGYFRGGYMTEQGGRTAYGKQIMKIRWQDIRKVKYYPKDRLIVVNGGFDERMAIFCSRKNYDEIEKRIRTGIIKTRLDSPDSF